MRYSTNILEFSFQCREHPALSEHPAYTKQMILVTAIVEQASEAVSQIESFIYLQADGEVQSKAVNCIRMVLSCLDTAITQVKSGKRHEYR